MNNITQIDGIRSKLIGTLTDAYKVYKWCDNWYDIYLFRLGVKKTISMKVEDGKTVKIDSLSRLNAFLSSGEHFLHTAGRYGIKIAPRKVEFNYKGRKIIFNFNTREELAHTLHMVSEQFIREQYSRLKVEGKDVIDVGASVGDTAIYFALNGAKHVYAFEPDKKACRLAVRNIKSNKLQDRITVINEPCGTKGNSLSSIIQRYEIANSVLKIDCEGCEYGFILGANTEGLKKCDQIILEYHYGYLDIEKVLKKLGFKVRHTSPKIYNRKGPEGRQAALGIIYADWGKSKII